MSAAARDPALVAAYRSGATMRECALQFGISLERVRQILRRDAPEAIRPPYLVPARRRRQPSSPTTGDHQ